MALMAAQRAPRQKTLHRRADDERPEGFEFRLRILHQRDAHVRGVRRQQILVMAGAFLPAAHDFVEIDLARADVLRRQASVDSRRA